MTGRRYGSASASRTIESVAEVHYGFGHVLARPVVAATTGGDEFGVNS